MIALAWRQFRTQAVLGLGVLVVIAVAVGLTGPHLAHVLHQAQSCRAQRNCFGSGPEIPSIDRFLRIALTMLVMAAPAAAGMFWGAPLVARELENGTFRLAWTQSVTRRRWLAVKLGVLGLTTAVAAALLSLMVTWWFSSLDTVLMDRFVPGHFDGRYVVVIGYALFAFVLGVALGSVLRRPVAAMAATLFAFVGVRLAVLEWIRPHFETPIRVTMPWQPPGPGPGISRGGPTGGPKSGDWVTSDQLIARGGHVISSNGGMQIGVRPGTHTIIINNLRCTGVKIGTPLTTGPKQFAHAVKHCADKLGLHEAVAFQPASRFWTFQWYEFALFVVLALLVSGLSYWWVTRRLT
ncbi:MAG: ABC transporter permease [Actinomycetota bacterium]|nr:ABC transporter permease [Actinomycetota bacterium]